MCNEMHTCTRETEAADCFFFLSCVQTLVRYAELLKEHVLLPMLERKERNGCRKILILTQFIRIEMFYGLKFMYLTIIK